MKSLYKRLLTLSLFWSVVIIHIHCGKQDEFLDKVPNNHLAVPSTIEDLQLMIQNEGQFNNSDPSYEIVSADEYYITEALFNASSQVDKNAYLWNANIWPNQTVYDWNNEYSAIYQANTILDALSKITVTSQQQSQADAIKGSALYFRSWAFYNLLQEFSLPYDSVGAGDKLGIPLRLSSDLNVKSTRATEKECYAQIIKDLKTAINLLPNTSGNITSPTSAIANGFLSRVCLSMGDYSEAFQYADGFLKSFNKLTDFNALTPSSYPISNTYLVEDAFHASAGYASIISSFRSTIIDSTLYNSYNSNDLRKACFFLNLGGGNVFTGTYDIAKGNLFTGITTAEIYLIRAECYARMNNKDAAMADLNTLLVKRWKTGTYIPPVPANSEDALKLILLERRKEMVFRGTRWADLRRLNQDSRFAITLSRNINGVTTTLPPNDPRYALPIPDDEIKLSGIQQNQR